jgi:glycosyltransferase involved in cell wall biosynthesis
MKILHVNTYDSGGAAIACIRIHNDLLKNGVDSHLLFRFKTKNIKNSSQYIRPHKFGRFSRILNLIKRRFPSSWERKKRIFQSSRPKNLEYYSFPDSECDITITDEYKNAEIIHLHWVANFLDWESFFKKNTKPLVWTLHDQNPFLGGEHYCERYSGIDTNGFPIPRIYTNLELEMENLLKFKKKVSLKNIRKIVIVPNSNWTLNSSLESDLFRGFKHKKINNTYPTDIFKKIDKVFF